MTMTNDDFDKFVQTRFGGKTSSAATELDMHRDTIDALRTGKTRKGAEYPVPRHVELAVKSLLDPDYNIQGHPPSRMFTLTWRHAFCGYWPDAKGVFHVSHETWTNGEANPGFQFKGMTMAEARERIKRIEDDWSYQP